jgi:hypothetical protein
MKKLYLVKATNHKGNILYKIGITKRMAGRIKDFKTSNPSEFDILVEFESIFPGILESTIKRHYEEFRVDGEWFNFPEDFKLENFVSEVKKIESNLLVLKENSTLNKLF